jgi:hypothetical protein
MTDSDSWGKEYLRQPPRINVAHRCQVRVAVSQMPGQRCTAQYRHERTFLKGAPRRRGQLTAAFHLRTRLEAMSQLPIATEDVAMDTSSSADTDRATQLRYRVYPLLAPVTDQTRDALGYLDEMTEVTYTAFDTERRNP